MERLTRRAAVAGALVTGATLVADPADAAGLRRRRPRRGSIANRMHRGRTIRTALFFAGPPNPSSLPLYTRNPEKPTWVDWTDEGNIRYALGQMRSAGLNTIKLSFWGIDGETDSWSPSLLFSKNKWHGSGTYTEAQQVALARQFFRIAASEGLLVAPMLEVSPAFPFYAQFPNDLTELVDRSTWLLRQFGNEPNYLRMRGRGGKTRHALWLIETIHAGSVSSAAFARGFDVAANRIAVKAGHTAGFVVDPTPLPPYGATAGPDPAALRATASILAVNPFNISSQGPHAPESQANLTETERLQYAWSVMHKWRRSGLPFIAPITPGYDAHKVFPGTGVYGHHKSWCNEQSRLALRNQTAGISVDCWNGWTEGYAVAPSSEYGRAETRWVRDVMRRLPR